MARRSQREIKTAKPYHLNIVMHEKTETENQQIKFYHQVFRAGYSDSIINKKLPIMH